MLWFYFTITIYNPDRYRIERITYGVQDTSRRLAFQRAFEWAVVHYGDILQGVTLHHVET